MKLTFWKMQGAGNDFILFDDRRLTFPVSDRGWISRIAERRTGIGSEGVILMQPSKSADFRMRFFNPDGSEVGMCGNGARCVALLAHELDAASERMSIETISGAVGAEILDEGVRLEMMEPKDWRIDRPLSLDGRRIQYSYVVAGVPHVVIETEDLEGCDVNGIGRKIRHHPDFAPAGTNVNFIKVEGPQILKIRTYERGVEGETMACGTGMVSSALTAAKRGRVSPPVKVLAASRDVLTVDFRFNRDATENVTLLGPAVHVFAGTVEY